MPSKTSRTKSPRDTDPIAMLMDDHRRVEKLFQQFEKAQNEEDKQELAELICAELAIHAQIEEEILYPFARECLEESDLLDEAEVEHTCAKELMAKIQSGESELFDAQVKVLSEYVQHHVKEEEKELFPKLKKFQQELQVPGVAMAERKMELMEEMGLLDPESEAQDGEASASEAQSRGAQRPRGRMENTHASMQSEAESEGDARGNRDKA